MTHIRHEGGGGGWVGGGGGGWGVGGGGWGGGGGIEQTHWLELPESARNRSVVTAVDYSCVTKWGYYTVTLLYSQVYKFI